MTTRFTYRYSQYIQQNYLPVPEVLCVNGFATLQRFSEKQHILLSLTDFDRFTPDFL